MVKRRRVAARSVMWWNIKNVWLIISIEHYESFRFNPHNMLCISPEIMPWRIPILAHNFELQSNIDLECFQGSLRDDSSRQESMPKVNEKTERILNYHSWYCVVSDMDHLLPGLYWAGDWKMGHMCATLSPHKLWLFHRFALEDNNVSVETLLLCLIFSRFCSNWFLWLFAISLFN